MCQLDLDLDCGLVCSYGWKGIEVFCIPCLLKFHVRGGFLPSCNEVGSQAATQLQSFMKRARRWFVGGHDAKDWKFRCEAGFIYSEPVPNGAMPDRAVGTWARFQGGIFLADPSITVKALPGLPDSGN